MFTNKIQYISLFMAASFSCGLFAFENRTYQEVLASNFKACELKKENVFLTKDQAKKIKDKLGLNPSKLVLRYKSPCTNSHIYVDSHIVRTLNETVVIEIKDNTASFLEIASFMEPKEYLPPKKWLKLLLTKRDDVDALTGATLTQNALKNVMNKYLYMDQILSE